MFYAYIIEKSLAGSIAIPIRIHGYKSLESAKSALDRKKTLGYIKKYGQGVPVYYRMH